MFEYKCMHLFVHALIFDNGSLRSTPADIWSISEDIVFVVARINPLRFMSRYHYPANTIQLGRGIEPKMF